MTTTYTCEYCGRKLGNPVSHRCNGNFRKHHLRFKQECGQQNIHYSKIVPKDWNERFDMYMQCKKEELASMLAERDRIDFPDMCSEYRTKKNKFEVSFSSSPDEKTYFCSTSTEKGE